jgi:NitT/TauT family transport system permease protein
VAGLIAWEALVRLSGLPAFILPPPSVVGRRFLELAGEGGLWRHTFVTLLEILAGLVVGVTIAFLLGYLVAKSPSLERILAPYIVASQSIPVVAIAPLMIIWFGAGTLSKVLISALIVFFPVLVNTVVGLRSVPADLHDLMRSLRATRWQTFTKLDVPASLPVMFGGLKIGATLAVIGAVVGEFVAADQGLGFLITLNRGLYDTAGVFVAVFLLIGLAMLMYSAVSFLERRMLGWRNRPEA